jgi:hypothetical protein
MMAVNHYALMARIDTRGSRLIFLTLSVVSGEVTITRPSGPYGRAGIQVHLCAKS